MPLDILNSTHMDNDGYRFFLSNNPWRCDCYSVTKFQVCTQAKCAIA